MKRVIQIEFVGDVPASVTGVEDWLMDRVWEALGNQGSPVFDAEGDTTGVIILSDVSISMKYFTEDAG